MPERVWSACGKGHASKVGERADGGILPGNYGHERIYAVVQLRLRGLHLVERLPDLDQGLRRIEVRASGNSTARKKEKAGTE